MPVVNKIDLWSDSLVPVVYASPAVEEIARPWIEEVNTAVGYDLISPKLDTDKNWVKVIQDKKGSSDEIGCLKKGEQKIYANTKRTMQHELLHALGFHHEQLHEDYAWDDKELDSKQVASIIKQGGRADIQKMLKGEYSKALHAAIAKGMGNSFAADANIFSRFLCVTDKGKKVDHLPPCDYNSIMMYPKLCEAAEAVKKVKFTDKAAQEVANKVKLTKGGLITEFLTENDVQALRHLYPKRAIRLPKSDMLVDMTQRPLGWLKPLAVVPVDKDFTKFLATLGKALNEMDIFGKASGFNAIVHGKDTPLFRVAVRTTLEEVTRVNKEKGWRQMKVIYTNKDSKNKENDPPVVTMMAH